MNKLFRIIMITLVLMTSIMASTLSFASESREIYLTRHAEKQHDGTSDPSLTEEGYKRASNLATFLKSKNIKTIYSTNYKRTMETANATAELLNITIRHYDPSALNEFAEQLISEKGNILVVGHSNTTPELVALLGGEAGEKMEETEFDRLYQLAINKNKVSTTIIRSL